MNPKRIRPIRMWADPRHSHRRVPANRTLSELQEDVLQVFIRSVEECSPLNEAESEYLTALCRRITWRGERGLK